MSRPTDSPSDRRVAPETSARPRAVLVAALSAAALAVANLLALVLSYDPQTPAKTAGSLAATALVATMAYGLWRARYWAVLGMETLLAITIVLSALALIRAEDWRGLLLLLSIIVASSALLWALARSLRQLELPQPPGSPERSGRADPGTAGSGRDRAERTDRPGSRRSGKRRKANKG